MRTATVLVLALVAAFAAASVIPERTRKVADKELLNKQRDILRLLIRVHQPSYVAEVLEVAQSFNPEEHLDLYKDQEAVKKLLALYRAGELLPRHKPFSVVYKRHVKQAVLVFDALYNAVDYQTFYKTAAYLRDRINEGQFIYALSVAVLHRQDTHDVVLPPPYEIYPEFFVNSEIIHEATEEYLQGKELPITINAAYYTNSSAWYYTYPQVSNPEQLLNYFTEDIGLNAFHTYFNYEYPVWFSASKYSVGVAPRRGEIFYYYLQQLFNRYQLERLSNGLPPVYPIDYDVHGKPLTGYAPQLTYHNGIPFPARPEGVIVSDVDIIDIEVVKNLERRLLDAIHLGVAFDESINKVVLADNDGIDILGNLISGNKDSINRKYYGSLYLGLRALFGHVVDPYHKYNVAPGVLEHFETALRDPAYYRIVARVIELFRHYKSLLKTYTREELTFPGVKIEAVDVDKLVTYVDDFVFDLNSAVEVPNVEVAKKLDIRVRQPRLNHKPFSVRVSVDSDKAARVAVRFYLGPKYNYLGRPLSVEERRQYLVEIDRFPFDLPAGKTVIERSSRDSSAVVPDQTITRVLLKKVEDAIEGREPYYVDSAHRHCGFPERLLLPKGSRQGLPLALYVVITPYGGDSLNTHTGYIACGAGFGYQVVDNKPYGYPFDRVIKSETDFFVPNIFYKDVTVFHKKQEEINKA
ncbi:hypothetical protein R5R35_001194 [Gryllus longicercus]|uniref:Hexamerin-like protein 2 n=1 Tax=Gryllus longicercus TaxID=2509291 RepID=A0AAN9W0R1_9ORTH